jgi:hypothetical protein
VAIADRNDEPAEPAFAMSLAAPRLTGASDAGYWFREHGRAQDGLGGLCRDRSELA